MRSGRGLSSSARVWGASPRHGRWPERRPRLLSATRLRRGATRKWNAGDLTSSESFPNPEREGKLKCCAEVLDEENVRLPLRADGTGKTTGGGHVGQPVARRTAHQTRTSQSQGAGRMPPCRSRRRPGARRVPLCSRSQEVAAGASARRALSPAQQSYRRRPGDAIGLLPPTRPNRGSVSNPQRRPRRQADPSSRAMANRSAHLHRLSRLLPARHHRPPPESAGAHRNGTLDVRRKGTL